MSTRAQQSNLASVLSSVPEKKPTKRKAPSGPTIGQITEKISALKSHIAITDMLVVHLETHYQGIDGEDPEEYVTREDYARVSPAHIEEYIASLLEKNEVSEKELIEWESMPVNQPTPTKKRAEDDTDTH